MVCIIHGWFRWFASYTDGEKKLFLKKKILPIHRWYKWSNIWFAPYTDGLDGLHHTQMATKKNYFFAVEHCFSRLVLDLASANATK